MRPFISAVGQSITKHSAEIEDLIFAEIKKQPASESKLVDFQLAIEKAKNPEWLSQCIDTAITEVFLNQRATSYNKALDKLESPDPATRALYTQKWVTLIYRAAIGNLFQKVVDEDILNQVENHASSEGGIVDELLKAISDYVKKRAPQATLIPATTTPANDGMASSAAKPTAAP